MSVGFVSFFYEVSEANCVFVVWLNLRLPYATAFVVRIKKVE